ITGLSRCRVRAVPPVLSARSARFPLMVLSHSAARSARAGLLPLSARGRTDAVPSHRCGVSLPPGVADLALATGGPLMQCGSLVAIGFAAPLTARSCSTVLALTAARSAFSDAPWHARTHRNLPGTRI